MPSGTPGIGLGTWSELSKSQNHRMVAKMPEQMWEPAVCKGQGNAASHSHPESLLVIAGLSAVELPGPLLFG